MIKETLNTSLSKEKPLHYTNLVLAKIKEGIDQKELLLVFKDCLEDLHRVKIALELVAVSRE